MKHYKTSTEIRAIEEGQEFLIQDDWVEITDEDLQAIINPPKTEEQIYIETYTSWKQNRQEAVNNIVVELDGVVYQGDEISQDRMARAIVAMDDTSIVSWVAKDNSVHELDKLRLRTLLLQAGIIQASIWNEGRPV